MRRPIANVPATIPTPALLAQSRRGQRKASSDRGFGRMRLPGHHSTPIVWRQGKSRRRARDTLASFRIGLAWSAANTIMLGASPRWDCPDPGAADPQTNSPVDRRRLREGPPSRPHRLGCLDRGGRGQRRRPARDAWHGCRVLRSRALLDAVPQEAYPTWAAWREAGHLRCSRGHHGDGLQDLYRHLAPLPRPLHAQRPGSHRPQRPTCCLGLHRHRLRPGRCQGGSGGAKSPISSGPRYRSLPD